MVSIAYISLSVFMVLLSRTGSYNRRRQAHIVKNVFIQRDDEYGDAGMAHNRDEDRAMDRTLDEAEDERPSMYPVQRLAWKLFDQF